MPEHGTFMWNELATTDPGAAKAFYQEIVGWVYEDVDMNAPDQPAKEGGPAYTICRAGEQMAGGMMKMEGEQWRGVPPHWISYIAVDDVDAAAAKVEPAGGTVRMAPFDIKGIGRIAVIADPTGAVVCLMKPAAESAG